MPGKLIEIPRLGCSSTVDTYSCPWYISRDGISYIEVFDKEIKIVMLDGTQFITVNTKPLFKKLTGASWNTVYGDDGFKLKLYSDDCGGPV